MSIAAIRAALARHPLAGYPAVTRADLESAVEEAEALRAALAPFAKTEAQCVKWRAKGLRATDIKFKPEHMAAALRAYTNPTAALRDRDAALIDRLIDEWNGGDLPDVTCRWLRSKADAIRALKSPTADGVTREVE